MSRGFTPDLRLDGVGSIDAEYLHANNIKALIVDLDNTLALPDDMNPTEEAKLFAHRMHQCGVPIVVVSNNSEQRVAGFCRELGFDYIYNAGKPFGKGIKLALKKTGVPKNNTVLVGDQILTDVLAASFNSMRCILTEPVIMEASFFFRLKRGIEWLIDNKRRNMRCSKKTLNL